ncbi:MAG: MurR/RpiR family transcriptional regulator [Lachnospiraceae bacterium]|jgi:DNA-binding MurR/RpiR family transcriptional regulator|nr:MurR/RpiR family transcriptional regulator [Lachnospiraceae bacterium]
MSLINDLKNASQLTERENDIRSYILSHPEYIVNMSCQSVGKATFTSASSVTRFCQKFGCKGYPDFKVRFLSDIKSGKLLDDPASVQLSERENMVTLLKKVSEVQAQALDATQKALSLSRLLRIRQLLLEHPCIDFYAYDTNIHLARYAVSQFFHAGKIAAVYSETDIQVLNTLIASEGHLAVLISHTGENFKLIELTRLLRRSGTKTIIITSGKETTLGKMADEFLYAPRPATIGEVETDKLSIPTFFTAAKYLLDLLFSIAFSAQYTENMSLNHRYDTIGAATFWELNESG